MSASDSKQNTQNPQGSSSDSPIYSVYVSELDPSATEAHLFAYFSKFGLVQSARVVKDPTTKRSLGYAYVNFAEPSASTLAVKESLVTLANGTGCVVSPFNKERRRNVSATADPDSSLTNLSLDSPDTSVGSVGSNGHTLAPASTAAQESRPNSVFVGNLDVEVTNEMLASEFSKAGQIVACKIAQGPYGQSRGFGYVQYATPAEAEAAITQLNGVQVLNRPIYVTHHQSRRERIARLAEQKENFTNLFVKNIDFAVTNEELTALFAKYGEIISLSLPKASPSSSNIQGCKGYAFVNYANHSDAVAAMKGLHEHELHGKQLHLSRAQSKYEREEEMRMGYERAKGVPAFHNDRNNSTRATNLYIKYLDSETDDNALRKMFERFGEITSAKVMVTPKGESRRFGFVCFTTAEAAQNAIAEMNDAEVNGQHLFVSLAQQRSSRYNNTRGVNNGINQYYSPQFYYPLQNLKWRGVPNEMPLMYPQAPMVPMQIPIPNNTLSMAAALNNGLILLPHMGGQMPVGGLVSGPGHVVQGPVQVPEQAPSAPDSPNFNKNKGQKNSRSMSQKKKVKAGETGEELPEKEDLQGYSLSAQVASASDKDEQRRILGEALYPRVLAHPAVNYDEDMAQNTTGMLLTQEIVTLMKWVDDDVLLSSGILQAQNAYVQYIDDRLAAEVAAKNVAE